MKLNKGIGLITVVCPINVRYQEKLDSTKCIGLDWIDFSIGYAVVGLELDPNCIHEENIAKGPSDPGY